VVPPVPRALVEEEEPILSARKTQRSSTTTARRQQPEDIISVDLLGLGTSSSSPTPAVPRTLSGSKRRSSAPAHGIAAAASASTSLPSTTATTPNSTNGSTSGTPSGVRKKSSASSIDQAAVVGVSVRSLARQWEQRMTK